MLTREERVAESLRLGAEQAAARANGQPIPQAKPRNTSQPRKVSVALRTRLQREFGLGCTTCFNVTLARLDALSIDQIRSQSSEIASSIRENAHEAARRTNGRTLIEWAKVNGNGDSLTAYERLVIEACEACQPKPTLGAIVIDATKHGFGDAMVTSWIGEGSKGTDRPLIHYATGEKAELLRLFGQQVIDEPQPNMRDTFTPGGRESAGMHITRLQHRAAHLQAGGAPKRPTLIELSQESRDFAATVADDNTVPMFPMAAHPIRIWPAAYWAELTRLLTEAGWKPLLLLDRDVPAFSKCNRQIGLSWEDELAIVQRTRLAITNSSGPAHVLGTMGHPTLVVCGPTDPHVAFGHLDSLRCIFEESMACIRCHYRAPKARPACWIGCEALHRLSPSTVMAEATKMLGSDPLHEVTPGMWRQVSRERVEYDDAYFDRFDGYRETEIHRQLIAARVKLVRKYGCESAVDVGIGAGTFVEALDCQGFDVMPKAVVWLKERGKYRSPYAIAADAPDAITCWDSLEHIEHPAELLECVRPGKYLFVSLPIFRDLADVLASKHYRPGEHLTYWTADGLIAWAARNGLTLIEANEMETDLGRDSIGTFVFKRPDTDLSHNTAYVIAGEMSAGNRLMAAILVRSGCSGNASTEQPRTKELLPEADGPFVVIRHAGLPRFIPWLREKGFERVVVIMVVREPVANIASLTTRGHFDSYRVARDDRANRIARNIVDAVANRAELEIVTYEGLTEESLREWLPLIGLPYVEGPLDLVGQNAPDVIESQNGSHYRE